MQKILYFGILLHLHVIIIQKWDNYSKSNISELANVCDEIIEPTETDVIKFNNKKATFKLDNFYVLPKFINCHITTDNLLYLLLLLHHKTLIKTKAYITTLFLLASTKLIFIDSSALLFRESFVREKVTKEQEMEKFEFTQQSIILPYCHYHPIIHMEKYVHHLEVLHLPTCLSQSS